MRIMNQKKEKLKVKKMNRKMLKSFVELRVHADNFKMLPPATSFVISDIFLKPFNLCVCFRIALYNK